MAKVQLRYVGNVQSKPAVEFEVGERMAFNDNYILEITHIEPVSKATLEFTFEDGSKARYRKTTQKAIG